ncbi:MAG TPA: Ku protein [Trebonia sp.]
MRHIWTGTLTVAALAFPVSLGNAVSREDDLGLHQVRREDGSRIRMKRYAEADGPDGPEVDFADTARGYDTGTGQTVILEKEDFARAYGEKDKQVKVEMFTDASGLPRTAHETSYYVEPGESGKRAYAMLAQAMLRAGKAAVVSFAVRQREATGVLYATGEGYLVLERLQWAADVRRPDFTVPVPEFTSAETAMMDTFVETFTRPLEWEKYTDQSRENLAAVIQAKLETGQALGTPAVPSAVTPPQDIMAVLTASVEQAQQARAAKAPVRKPRARKAVA